MYRACCNEVAEQELVATDNFEINLKENLNVIGNEKEMEKDMGTQMELMDKLLLQIIEQSLNRKLTWITFSYWKKRALLFLEELCQRQTKGEYLLDIQKKTVKHSERFLALKKRNENQLWDSF